MGEPYFQADGVQLYHGDCREIVPALGQWVDLIIADPPYGETSLAWDSWPERWPTEVSMAAQSMWVFGSLRMFLERRDSFADWILSQDVVWEKQNGTGFAADRFRRVHEHAVHWYRGNWSDIYRDVPRVSAEAKRGGDVRRRDQPTHTGAIASRGYADDGRRLHRSVIRVRNEHHQALHPTQKPIGILAPVLEYGCPPGGIVLDPFAGSGSTAIAAVMSGRRAILIEADERYCEVIAKRLSQGVLPTAGGAA